ncbi:hypothetical protein FACS1894153_4460 [Bacteroidia bacterium]|nr:hypothetical protein FACS1894153_4460 [Bacteroidia bacterium]
MKGLKNAPYNDISETDIQNLIMSAMRQSDRYRTMKADGYSEEEILKAFKTKTKMRVFSWDGKKDTIMTPWDSLIYHKWFLHCGMMSVEPQTGYVKAYVGGIDYNFFQFDNVIHGKRQVGSTFKPFVYTKALKDGGYTPCTKVPNVKVCIETPHSEKEDWCPKNSDNKREGEMVTLKWALANSVNFVSAYLIKRFPPQTVIDLARKMGITSPIDPVPSICLGSCDLSVYEMTGAFSTFVNEGLYIKPTFITRIEDKHGNILETFVPESNEAISKDAAYMTVRLLQGVVDAGTGVRLRYKYGLNGAIAGKTGTTQNQSDGWFMGCLPRLVTGVWVGGEVRSIHFRSITYGQGANMALPIWALFAKRLYSDKTLDYLGSEQFVGSSTMRDAFDCSEKQTEIDPSEEL